MVLAPLMLVNYFISKKCISSGRGQRMDMSLLEISKWMEEVQIVIVMCCRSSPDKTKIAAANIFIPSFRPVSQKHTQSDRHVKKNLKIRGNNNNDTICTIVSYNTHLATRATKLRYKIPE